MTGLLQKLPRLKKPFIFIQHLFTALIRFLERYPFYNDLKKVACVNGRAVHDIFCRLHGLLLSKASKSSRQQSVCLISAKDAFLRL